jgi:hypothetical protein
MSLKGRTHKESRSPEELLSHLLSRTTPGPGGCLLWTGYVSADGYSRASYQRVGWVGSRLVYTLARGPIPHGYEIDHTCHSLASDCDERNDCLHRRCLNPEHLEAVSREDHIARRRTSCKRGHEFNLANARRGRDGQWHCRLCQRVRQAEGRRRRRLAEAAS